MATLPHTQICGTTTSPETVLVAALSDALDTKGAAAVFFKAPVAGQRKLKRVRSGSSVPNRLRLPPRDRQVANRAIAVATRGGTEPPPHSQRRRVLTVTLRVQNLMTIVHSFSSRLYGLSSYKTKLRKF